MPIRGPAEEGKARAARRSRIFVLVATWAVEQGSLADRLLLDSGEVGLQRGLIDAKLFGLHLSHPREGRADQRVSEGEPAAGIEPQHFLAEVQRHRCHQEFQPGLLEVAQVDGHRGLERGASRAHQRDRRERAPQPQDAGGPSLHLLLESPSGYNDEAPSFAAQQQ